MKNDKKNLPAERTEELLALLKVRFEKNMKRHKGLDWNKIQAKLEANPEKLWSLNEMDTTGGEPDVVGYDKKTDEYIFYDSRPYGVLYQSNNKKSVHVGSARVQALAPG